MKIIVKQINKPITENNINIVNEYLIYLNKNGINIKAFIEYGDELKQKRINELFHQYFGNSNLPIEEIVNEIKLKK